MKLQLAHVPPKEHIKAILEQHLPQYQYSFRIGKFVDCKKSFFTGATVVPKQDGIVINESFPSAGATMLFMLIMFASGILIGLLLWLLVFKGGQNRVRDDVARVLAGVLGAQLPPGMQAQQPQMQTPHHQQPQMHQPQQPQLAAAQVHQPAHPNHQHPQQMQQPQHQHPQHAHPQELPVGARVTVTAQDGNRYPATIAQPATQGQYLCTMPDGQSYWFPQQAVSAG